MTNHSKELEKEQNNESKLIKRLMLFSLLGHMVFALFYIIKLPTRSKPIESIEAELVLTTNLGQDKQDSDTEKSKVEKNTLPQLTKSMIIKQEPPKKAIAIESLKEEEKRKEIIRKKRKERELTKKEALKRILRERAREKKEFAAKEKLRLNESIKRLKSMNENINILGAGTNGKYNGVVQSWIQRHFEIPEAYNIPKEGIEINLLIFLNRDGEVVNIKVQSPSKNPLFNKIALQTVWKSSPLPKPPLSQVGKGIPLTFTPSKY